MLPWGQLAMGENDKRKDVRKELAMETDFHSLLEKMTVAVCDISENGCRLDVSGLILQAGNRVMLRPEGFEAFLGTVKWVSNEKAGVEFDTPLHPAVVDHLCRMHPDANNIVSLDIAA